MIATLLMMLVASAVLAPVSGAVHKAWSMIEEGYKIVKRVNSAKRMMTKDGTSSMRAAAALRLSGDPDPSSGTALATSSAGKSWLVRVAVVDAIADRDDPGLLEAIIPLLDDDHDAVKYDAADAVVRLSGRESPRDLIPRR